MGDYVTLLGAEDVKQAGYKMVQAAESMAQTEANFEQTLLQHRQWMEEWLERLEDVMKSKEA